MSTTSVRRGRNEPTPALASALGRLFVSSAQLTLVAEQVAATADVQPELERLDAARDQWRELAAQLLELRRQVEVAAASQTFTGSAGEHLTIESTGQIRVPADAAYLTVLSQRMDRHARVGRMFAVAATV